MFGLVTINGRTYHQRKKIRVPETPLVCEYFKATAENNFKIDCGICPIDTSIICERPIAENPDLCQIRLAQKEREK